MRLTTSVFVGMIQHNGWVELVVTHRKALCQQQSIAYLKEIARKKKADLPKGSRTGRMIWNTPEDLAQMLRDQGIKVNFRIEEHPFEAKCRLEVIE